MTSIVALGFIVAYIFGEEDGDFVSNQEMKHMKEYPYAEIIPLNPNYQFDLSDIDNVKINKMSSPVHP